MSHFQKGETYNIYCERESEGEDRERDSKSISERGVDFREIKRKRHDMKERERTRERERARENERDRERDEQR